MTPEAVATVSPMMEYWPPPSVGPPQNTPGVLVVVGLAGITAAIGAAASGFLVELGQNGVIEYAWGDTLRFAAVFAFAGGMLAMFQHELGIPVVIGALATIVAVVGSVLAGLHFKTAPILDPFPGRGLLFIGAGFVGFLGLIVGLVGLRGSGPAAFGIPVALLALVSLAATAGVLRLDSVHHAQQLRPFGGYAFIALVCIVCSFAGRFGMLAAVVAASTIASTFIDSIEFGAVDRRWVAVIDVVALSAMAAIGVGAVAVVSRRTQANGEGWGNHPALEPSTYPTSPVPLTSVTSTQYAQAPAPAFGASPYAAVADVFIQPATYQLPTYQPPTFQTPTFQTPDPLGPTALLQPGFSASVEPAVSAPTIHLPRLQPFAQPDMAERLVVVPAAVQSVPLEPVPVAVEPVPAVEPTSVFARISDAGLEVDPVSLPTSAVSTIGQWASDPYGHHELRYWDGRQWTEQVQTAGKNAIDPV
jgi:hypothetical protein